MLRASMPRTFDSWFTRFDRLTPIQERAIPAILGGTDVLISAATASGKTEAYAAPASEIALAHGCPAGGILIASPTRALANDLKRRLEGPLDRVGVGLGRYTGEHKELVRNRLPAITITTPEALDSMLARRAHLLDDLRLLVLDEIHVLDGSARGDQLRILLHRVRSRSENRVQVVAASATIDRPEQLAARYLHKATIVTVPGARRILVQPFDGTRPDQIRGHLDYLAEHGLRKILVFCRSRNQVENLGTRLRGHGRFGTCIYTHHGSLAKSFRERTERLFLTAPAAVCFATLTLEMGIDIGTVDYVLLVGLPGDVSSLLQRIGRGGRRGDTTRSGFAYETSAEHHVFMTMFRQGKAGRLCSHPYAFRPSVLIQQALVLACVEGWVTRDSLAGTVPPSIAEELELETADVILEELVEAGTLERGAGGRFLPSEAVEGRHLRGALHSNIQDRAGIEVIDRMTGDTIGEVGAVDTPAIELGGSDREVAAVQQDRILTDRGGEASPARFRPNGAPSVSLSLARAVVEDLGLHPHQLGLFAADGAIWLLHGLGSAGALWLGKALKACGVRSCGAYVAELARPPEALPQLEATQLPRFVEDHLGKLEGIFQPGPYASSLPRPLRVASALRGCGITEVAEYVAESRLANWRPPSNEALDILTTL